MEPEESIGPRLWKALQAMDKDFAFYSEWHGKPWEDFEQQNDMSDLGLKQITQLLCE